MQNLSERGKACPRWGGPALCVIAKTRCVLLCSKSKRRALSLSFLFMVWSFGTIKLWTARYDVRGFLSCSPEKEHVLNSPTQNVDRSQPSVKSLRQIRVLGASFSNPEFHGNLLVIVSLWWFDISTLTSVLAPLHSEKSFKYSIRVSVCISTFPSSFLCNPRRSSLIQEFGRLITIISW